MSRVNDPGKGKVKLGLQRALTAVVAGMAAGCRGLGALDELAGTLGKGARKQLGIYKRIADTTLHDLLVRLWPDDVRVLRIECTRQDKTTGEVRAENRYDLTSLAAGRLQARPDQTWIPVTSASHMPRAMGCFRVAGWPGRLVAWPVDYMSPPAPSRDSSSSA